MILPPYHSEVYQPEADTYLLLKTAKKEVHSGEIVLEVGTGSGLISAELQKNAHVFATDINPHACLSAKGMGIEVIRTDLMAGICGSFDLIIFNPPYLPTPPDERINDWFEYALDGGESGRETIENFASDLCRIMTRFGRALVLVSSLTEISEVQKLFAEKGLLCFVVAQKKVEDETLYVIRIMRDLCRCACEDLL